ncbi:MAG TPA: AraC family transcriptional regulator [Ideonella sp.]|uniref:AraC family transcriptional regulator n=1 Tax=Ideonella sp. TaxID=1929293 RepID=UPI002BECD147|nr:AraC family transcriptional regulator [Ideonella sp.]HSI50762.1 AraC family transcriptional regulator [Ideonella sp.]
MRTSRNPTPELEHDLIRLPCLGYEPAPQPGLVRCVEHGSPTPLERWHCHDEYELQLIVGARGHAFIGDHVGAFEPGHLVLTGPRLPHNWVSTDLPPEGLAVRSLVLQFLDQPLQQGLAAVGALDELKPLLERSRHGIEFFGLSAEMRTRFHGLKAASGLERLGRFLDILGLLAHWPDYRLLSSVQLQRFEADATLAPLKAVIQHAKLNFTEPLGPAEAARLVGMNQRQFARHFSRCTGGSFTAFLTRLRVNHACELLLQTELLVSSICYQAGFNNMANFDRHFLRLKGLTPSAYRRLAQARFGRPAS